VTWIPAQMLAAFDFRVLATVDAILNGIATLLIVAGLIAVKRRALALHKALMLAAASVSALFLVSYVIYHLNGTRVPFQGQGAIRTAYYTLLLTHVVLAVVQVPLILRTIWLGLHDRREQHRKWAKVTAPIWLYVSVTGVVVYLLLYHWRP
jgi:putative membrane protein